MSNADNIFDIFDEFDKKHENLSDIEQNIEDDSKDLDLVEKDVCKDDSCSHINTVNESGTYLCRDCGVELSKVMSYEKDWRYYGSDDTRKNSDPNRCHIRKVEDKSIFKDVESFGFSENPKLSTSLKILLSSTFLI